MRRALLLAVFAALTLSACGGVIDRDPSGLYDPGTTDITRQHHQ
jgi:hypothetical protein